MIRCWISCSLVLLLGVQAAGQGPKSKSWLYRIGQILGLDRTPLGLKGADEEIGPGDIWIADVRESGPPPRLLAAGKFRFPIVQAGGNAVFAMQGDMLVRLALPGGAVHNVATIPNVLRLVGFDSTGGRFLALISRDPQHFDAVLFTAAGARAVVAGQNIGVMDEDAGVVLSNVRTYGTLTVYAENQKIKIGRSGRQTTIDDCVPGNCGDPSYAPERQLSIYIKTPAPK